MEVVLRKLTSAERAHRAAIMVADKREVDRAEIELMAAEFQRATQSQPMETAPRDGTLFLAYLYYAADDEDYRGFGEWREIFYKEHQAMLGWHTPWHAGDPYDSHSGEVADTHYGEAVPIAWLPLPRRPNIPTR
jgi:hypothetical protein